VTTAGQISKRDRMLGGLWGSLAGDALGVPVEFKGRAALQADPVREMRGFGTHNQPAGTWSDDSSLLLCSVDGLNRHEFNTEDMGKRFCEWYRGKLWTPHGKVFDMGIATSQALGRIIEGVRAEVAGGSEESSNGNGSLMRIIPVVVRFAEASTKQLLDKVHRASAITHRHPRSQMACGMFALTIRELLIGKEAGEAASDALVAFRSFYEPDPWWAVELEHFELLLAGDLARQPELEIDSTGYVMDTLTAGLWCLLTTTSFEECVLKAVNLGGDTDTTGCVAGGLAGVHYGSGVLPQRWIQSLARRDEIEVLFNRFADVVASSK